MFDTGGAYGKGHSQRLLGELARLRPEHGLIGMRKARHMHANLAASDGGALAPELPAALRPHRWDRPPAPRPD